MPNWCSNSLTISGDKDSIQRILLKIEMIQEKDGVFEELVGIGDIGRDEYESGGWYNWNISRFGTKWDVDKETFMCGFSLDDEDDEVSFSVYFDTAWSPPSAFVLLLSDIYGVNVEIESEEGGNDFYYKAKAINGYWDYEESYEFEQGHYLFNIDYFWDSIVDYAIENWLEDEIEVTKSVVQERFPFIEDKNDIKTILTDFEKRKKEYEKETNQS
jgi:Ferredoxin-like domain in Api92-like protein